jgi:UDP-N-acetyl-D-mannosaminuronic acid dehydrogenase
MMWEFEELPEIAENSYKYVQICMNTLRQRSAHPCKESGVCLYELKNAINTKWNVDILEPIHWIEEHCLPKDTKIFLRSSHQPTKGEILTTAIIVDTKYRTFKAQKILFRSRLSRSETTPNDSVRIWYFYIYW